MPPAIIVPAGISGGPFQIVGATAGGGGGPVSLTFTDHKYDGSGSSGAITFNAGGDPSIGTANANRIVVVGFGRRGDGTISSCTIAGVTATQVSGAYNSGNGIEMCDIWYAAVPTGTTATIVATWGGTTFSDAYCGVYRLITTTPTPTVAKNTGAASGSLSLAAYTVPANGASVNFWSQRDSGTSGGGVLWTNTSAGAGDFFDMSDGRGFSGSMVLTAGSVTVSCTNNPGSNPDAVSMCGAAWGP